MVGEANVWHVIFILSCYYYKVDQLIAFLMNCPRLPLRYSGQVSPVLEYQVRGGDRQIASRAKKKEKKKWTKKEKRSFKQEDRNEEDLIIDDNTMMD